jgi:hypothetical protein
MDRWVGDLVATVDTSSSVSYELHDTRFGGNGKTHQNLIKTVKITYKYRY